MTNATDAKVYAGIPLSEAVACGKRYAREEGKLRPRLAQTFDSLIAAVAALQAEVARLRDRMLELERQRDDYLNREWAATKAKQAAEAEAARLRTVDEAMVGRALRSYWGTKGKTFTKDKCHAMRRALIAAMGSANGQG